MTGVQTCALPICPVYRCYWSECDALGQAGDCKQPCETIQKGDRSSARLGRCNARAPSKECVSSLSRGSESRRSTGFCRFACNHRNRRQYSITERAQQRFPFAGPCCSRRGTAVDISSLLAKRHPVEVDTQITVNFTLAR